MKSSYTSALTWVVKLQWQTSKFSFAWTAFNSTATGLLPILETFILAKLISSVGEVALRQAASNPVYTWLLVLLALELFRPTLSNLNRAFRFRFQQKMDIAMNERFFVKMYELSQEQYDDEAFNTKLDRARDSLHQIWRVVDEFSSIFSSCITFIGSLVAILLISPLIGVIIVLAAIPVTIIQLKQNAWREEAYKNSEPLERVAYRTRWLLMDPNFMPEIRLMNAFSKMLNSWRTHSDKANAIILRVDKKVLISDVSSEAVPPLVGFGATIYFFNLLVSATISLDRFIFLRGMLGQAISGARNLADSVQNIHGLFISLHNFSEIYGTQPAIPNGSVKVVAPLEIRFDNVGFSYPGGKDPVLSEISFTIKPGDKIALVGENGAGKSTLLKLLLRQYLPTSGKITINGTNIRDVELESYYRAISNLSQDFLLINHLTIRDNLTIGLASDSSAEEMHSALELVDANTFVSKLPHKLSTRLDSSFKDGSNLSGGQRQRIAIARAMLRNGNILILDEPTSAIDAKAEYTIFNNIYMSHSGKTTVIVSHRFSTVRKADTIFVLQAGRIIEHGSHEELIKNNGLYKELFQSQAEGYK